MQYWSKLTVAEKESLLVVAKNSVQLKQEGMKSDDMHKRMIKRKREEYLRGEGISYSWEEGKQMAVNKEKRHAL